MGYRLATAALGPYLLCQGRQVRKSVPKLPEATGERQGMTGTGPDLRLLVLGDSAAAGVGAEHQDQALLGNLVRMLSKKRRVHWRLIAKTGTTTSETLQYLTQADRQRFDVVVISLGVNDVTSVIGCGKWLRQHRKLRALLRSNFTVQQIIACGLPPMHGFPALPNPLRWYLGSKASHFDQALQRDLETETDAEFLSLRFTTDVSQMAADGFHPGPGAYREWAQQVCRVISSLDF